MKKQLIWVYPPNNWTSNFHRTFVYGWSHPKAKLFIQNRASASARLAPTRIKIFPNGNFAQSIRLSQKQNVIRLIQILNGKKKILTRKVFVKK